MQQTQVEIEEEHITNHFLRRLDELQREKQQLALQVKKEEEWLDQLRKEKAALENALEAEQELISNKLMRKLERLAEEKASLQKHQTEMQRQVNDLADQVARLGREKIDLENAMEQEEEALVNRLQRQLQHVTAAYKILEARLEAAGVSAKAGDPLISSSDWMYGRSPTHAGRSADRLRSISTRERSASVSSTSSARMTDADNHHYLGRYRSSLNSNKLAR